MNNKEPHSFNSINDLRDHWWNPDFIALMAKRWELSSVKSMLDVGCGVGHWGQILLPYLAEDASMVGIDPENDWVEKAKQRALDKGLTKHSEYRQAAAENLPFPDNHFDMVTCQTVLIHLKEVALAISEMKRVLKPGGLLAVSEPNNSVSCLIRNNLNFHDPIDDIVDSVRFQLTYERGKSALQEGHYSHGDIIPWYFYQAGLQEIKVFLSDLADYFVPPYNSTREQLTISMHETLSEADWKKEEEEFQQYFLAGGGSLPEFKRLWPGVIKRTEQVLQGCKAKNFCSSGGVILYLISGRKI